MVKDNNNKYNNNSSNSLVFGRCPQTKTNSSHSISLFYVDAHLDFTLSVQNSPFHPRNCATSNLGLRAHFRHCMIIITGLSVLFVEDLFQFIAYRELGWKVAKMNLVSLSVFFFFFFWGSIVPSTILSNRSRSATLENPTDKVRERRDLNPGLLGEKRERYLYAMPPPPPKLA